MCVDWDSFLIEPPRLLDPFCIILHYYYKYKSVLVPGLSLQLYLRWPQKCSLFIGLHLVKWLPMKPERTNCSLRDWVLSCFETPNAWSLFKLYSKYLPMCVYGLIVYLHATEIRSRGTREWKRGKHLCCCHAGLAGKQLFWFILYKSNIVLLKISTHITIYTSTKYRISDPCQRKPSAHLDVQWHHRNCRWGHLGERQIHSQCTREEQDTQKRQFISCFMSVKLP